MKYPSYLIIKKNKHMKTILQICIILFALSTKAQTIYTVTKTTDPDPFVYPYDYEDSLCAPEMYGTLQWAIRKANDTQDSVKIVFNIFSLCLESFIIVVPFIILLRVEKKYDKLIVSSSILSILLAIILHKHILKAVLTFFSYVI